MSRRRQRSDSYTNLEYVDMLMCFGFARSNCAEAQKRYQSLHPKRKIPEESFFAEVDRRLRETGSVHLLDNDIDDPAMPIEERIRFHYHETPTIHMRTVAQLLNESIWKIWTTVYDKKTPKNIPKNQKGELFKRRQTAMFLFDADLEDPNFFTSILWTGEVKFTKTGIIKLTEEPKPNKLKKIKSKSNQDISLNVLMAIAKDNIYGPYFLPDNLTDAVYADFLKQIIEDLPLASRRATIYQNDGSSRYFGQKVKDYLNEMYRNKWIGKDGPIPLIYIPELLPLEYHIWPKMTSLVYDSRPVETMDELRKRIVNATEEVRKELTVKVVDSDMRKRVRMFLRHKGSFTDEQLRDGSSSE